MFSIFTHVMKLVRDTNSEPGLPVERRARKAKFIKSSIQRSRHTFLENYAWNFGKGRGWW